MNDTKFVGENILVLFLNLLKSLLRSVTRHYCNRGPVQDDVLQPVPA